MVRFLQNLFFPDFLIRFWFPRSRKEAIKKLVETYEKGHAGEFRICVEASLPLLSIVFCHTARRRAEELFASKRVWDTEGNTGILFYLLLSEHRLEIVCDRGIKFQDELWRDFTAAFAVHAAQGAFEAAFNDLLSKTQRELILRYPQIDAAEDPNEIEDDIDLL